MQPSSDEQIKFLVNLRRLLDEGLFVALYKFALLLALADLSIEQGDDSGAPLQLSTEAIAQKFIQYYWRQALPYPAASKSRVLRQNTGNQAAVLSLTTAARSSHGDSLPALMRQTTSWRKLVQKVAGVVRVMPLWKLVNVVEIFRRKPRLMTLVLNQADERSSRMRELPEFAELRAAWLN